jgi:hypothetical protein
LNPVVTHSFFVWWNYKQLLPRRIACESIWFPTRSVITWFFKVCSHKWANVCRYDAAVEVETSATTAANVQELFQELGMKLTSTSAAGSGAVAP